MSIILSMFIMIEKATKLQKHHPTLKLHQSMQALTFIKLVCIFPAAYYIDIIQENTHVGVPFLRGSFLLSRW